MTKQKSAEVTVKFRSPSFIHKGIKYLSKDVEAAAAAGDKDAKRLITDLVIKQSGVISVEEVAEPEVPKADKAPKEPKAAKAPKAPKAPKASKGAKAPKEPNPAKDAQTEKEDDNA